MKFTKRMLSLMLAGILCLAIACAALAEGKLLTMWNAGSKLLFETDNVTLNAHATFTYDGKLFKTFNGTYVQDGVNSYLQAMFDTPKLDGTIYTGGYTVIANEGQAYSIDTDMPRFYKQNTTKQTPSILTNTVIRGSLMRFGGLLLDLMEDRMAGAITETATETGTEYVISLKQGEAPEIAGAAVTALVQLAAKEYLYIDPQEYVDQMNMLNLNKADIWMDDWDALFAQEYTKAYGEAMPDNFYEMLWDANGETTAMHERYVTVVDAINALSEKYESQYPTGVVIIQNDGSAVHYATQDEYIIATGNQMVYYDDADLLFRKYYEEKTGTPLSADDMHAIWMSNNYDLIDAYSNMAGELWEKYYNIARENNVSCISVHSDGTYTLSNNSRALSNMSNLDYMTPTRRILYSLESMDIGNTDMAVRLSKDGRVESVSGTVTFITHDLLGASHELTIAFNGTADHYGDSAVEIFDPDKYNVTHIKEYYQNPDAFPNAFAQDENTKRIDLPETLVFDGVEYKVVIDEDLDSRG